MNISLIVLLAVFVLIAVRKVGRVRLHIWQIMTGGAAVVLLAGRISPWQAVAAIQSDVMLFLFGVFVVGRALEASGYLFEIAHRFFGRTRSTETLVLFVLFGVGIASALLMNDTLAVVGTPLMLLLAKEHRMRPKVLLLALAIAVTTGSVTSPIGNPQNLLIAIGGNVENPFLTFLRYLFVPTVINLFAAFWLLKIFYRDDFHADVLIHQRVELLDPKLATLAKVSLLLLIALITVKILIVMLGINVDFRLTYIALIAALPILLLSPRRFEIVRQIDWHTLVFFAAMFILMKAIWASGFFQTLLARTETPITSIPLVLAVSVLLSQLISNVPLVALYLPMLMEAGCGTRELMALAAGSTIAGNLFILGAASTVIIIQNAERRSGATIAFLEFARVGIPLTLVNVLIYWLFLEFS